MPRTHEENIAGGRNLDAAGRAAQQRHAELGLEPPDLLGEARLGHVQGLRGSRERPVLDRRDEVRQLLQCHRLSLSMI
jgi:hypothetical protein